MMNEMISPTQKKFSFMKLAGLLIAMAVTILVMVFVGIILLTWLQFDDLKVVQEKIASVEPIFIGLRWSFLINLVIFWNRFNTYLAKKFNWDNDRLERLLKQRFKVSIVLIIIELVINQRILDYWI